MKTEKRKITKMVLKSIEKEVDIFITSDEKEFENKSKALKHENKLKAIKSKDLLSKKLKIMKCEEFTLCYIESIVDASNHFTTTCCDSIKIDHPLPDWFKVEFFDGGDYKDSFYFTPFSETIKEYNRMLKHIEDSEVPTTLKGRGF